MPRRSIPKRRNPKVQRSRRRGAYGVETLPRLAVAGATTMAIMGIGGAMANSFRGG